MPSISTLQDLSLYISKSFVPHISYATLKFLRLISHRDHARHIRDFSCMTWVLSCRPGLMRNARPYVGIRAKNYAQRMSQKLWSVDWEFSSWEGARQDTVHLTSIDNLIPEIKNLALLPLRLLLGRPNKWDCLVIIIGWDMIDHGLLHLPQVSFRDLNFT